MSWIDTLAKAGSYLEKAAPFLLDVAPKVVESLGKEFNRQQSSKNQSRETNVREQMNNYDYYSGLPVSEYNPYVAPSNNFYPPNINPSTQIPQSTQGYHHRHTGGPLVAPANLPPYTDYGNIYREQLGNRFGGIGNTGVIYHGEAGKKYNKGLTDYKRDKKIVDSEEIYTGWKRNYGESPEIKQYIDYVIENIKGRGKVESKRIIKALYEQYKQSYGENEGIERLLTSIYKVHTR